MRLFNRQSPRIHANRIFLAFGCSASADACKSKICVPPQMGFAHLGFAYAESHPLWKNAIRKTRVRVFLLFHNLLISQKEKLTERKTGTPVFLIAFFQTACDSCVGEAQTGKACLRRHANLRFARISRSRARRRKKNAIRVNSRRFAVKYSLVSTHNNLLPKLD